MLKHSNDTYLRAQFLYQVDRLPLVEVSERTGVTVHTLKKWREKENWDHALIERKITNTEVAQMLTEHIARIITATNEEDRPLNSGDVDRIVKLTAAQDRLDGSLKSVANAVETLERFGLFMKHKYPNEFGVLPQAIMEFLNQLRRELK